MVVGCYDAPSRNRNRSPVYRCLPSASVGFRQLPPTVLTVHTRSGVRSMWSWVLGLSYAWNGWSEDITACRWLQFVHAPCSSSLHAHQLAGLQYLIYLAAMATVALYCTQPCRSTVSCLRLGSSCTPLQYAVECAVAAVSCLEGVRPTLGRVRGHLVITQWPCSLPAPRLDGANARSEHPVWALASKHALCRCGLMHGDDTCREWDLQWQCHLLHTRNVDVLTRTRPCTQDLHCL